jgi:hypothetical protein
MRKYPKRSGHTAEHHAVRRQDKMVANDIAKGGRVANWKTPQDHSPATGTVPLEGTGGPDTSDGNR